MDYTFLADLHEEFAPGTEAPGDDAIHDSPDLCVLTGGRLVDQIGISRLLLVLGGSGGDGAGVELADDEVDHRDEVAVGAVPAGAAFRGLDQ